MEKACSKWGDQMKIKAELPLGTGTQVRRSNNGTHKPQPCSCWPSPAPPSLTLF